MSPSAILLGSKPGAVVALHLLLENGWDVKAVVASDSEPTWLPRPTLYDEARRLGIPTLTDQSGLGSSDGVDLVISYMYRVRVSSKTRGLGKYAINFHAGPLPEYGGWAFYSVAILEDSPTYGCTCHLMDEGFDTGPVVKVRHFDVDIQSETALSLERKAQVEMVLLFREIIVQYQTSGRLDSRVQEKSKVRYLDRAAFDKLKKIPLEADSARADKIARAFWYPPYQIAYYQLPSEGRVEVVPEIAKNGLAPDLHSDDLAILVDSLTQNNQHLSLPTSEVDNG